MTDGQIACESCGEVIASEAGDDWHWPVDCVIEDAEPVGVRRVKGFRCLRSGGGHYKIDRIKDGIVRGAL